jgi:hypothetical protein
MTTLAGVERSACAPPVSLLGGLEYLGTALGLKNAGSRSLKCNWWWSQGIVGRSTTGRTRGDWVDKPWTDPHVG